MSLSVQQIVEGLKELRKSGKLSSEEEEFLMTAEDDIEQLLLDRNGWKTHWAILSQHLRKTKHDIWEEGRAAGLNEMANKFDGQYTLIDGGSGAWSQAVQLLRRDASFPALEGNPYDKQ